MLPSTQDYKIALMIGADSFRTLENVEVVPNPAYPSEPWYSTGGLAIVFKIKIEGKAYALKCFHKEAEDRQYRLEKIAEYIQQNPSPYWVDFQYIENELWVETNGNGQGYPVVLMEWIEGQTLDNYIKTICISNDRTKYLSLEKRNKLKELYLNFCLLSSWLLKQPISHGDLKHDNILVLESGKLLLIDYDGVFVPQFKGMLASELGTPEYQSPQRSKTHFDENVDNFSTLIILVSLYAFYIDFRLFLRFSNSDSLLFSENDIANLKTCSLTKELFEISKDLKDDNILSELLGLLNNSIERPINTQDFHAIIYSEEIIDYYTTNTTTDKQRLTVGQEYIQSIMHGFMEKGLMNTQKNIINILKGFIINEEMTLRTLQFLMDNCMKDQSFSIYSFLKSVGFPYSNIILEKYTDFEDNYSYEVYYEFEELYPSSLSGRRTHYSKRNLAQSLLSTSTIEWEIDVLEKYEALVDWKEISKNTAISWEKGIFLKCSHLLDWKEIINNPSVFITIEILEIGEHHIPKSLWKYGSFDKTKISISEKSYNIEWNNNLIERFKDNLDWKLLAENPSIQWTLSQVVRYYSYFKGILPHLQKNISIQLDLDYIKTFDNDWSWEELSSNVNIKWTTELIDLYKDKWNWKKLSNNKSINWTNSLVLKYEDRWDWISLLTNQSIPSIYSLIDYFLENRPTYITHQIFNNPTVLWHPNLIEKYKKNIDFRNLSKNKSIEWTDEIIILYEKFWVWSDLIRNESIFWSANLLFRYFEVINNPYKFENNKYRWAFPSTKGFNTNDEGRKNWDFLILNGNIEWSTEVVKALSIKETFYKSEKVPWSYTFLKKNQKYINWEKLVNTPYVKIEESWVELLIQNLRERILRGWELSKKREFSLSSNRTERHSLQIYFEENKKGFSWIDISKDKLIQWDLGLLDYYKENLYWDILSLNPGLPWDKNLILRFESEINWDYLSRNTGVPWDLEIIDFFKNKWNWNELSANESLPWSLELIEFFVANWNWSELSRNSNILWSIELLEIFKDRFDWKQFSVYNKIIGSLELIEKFKDKLDWNYTLSSCNIPFSIEIVDNFVEYIDFKSLTRSNCFVWSESLIDKYVNRWDWEFISGNKEIPWSNDLLDKYWEKLCWGDEDNGWGFSPPTENTSTIDYVRHRDWLGSIPLRIYLARRIDPEFIWDDIDQPIEIILEYSKDKLPRFRTPNVEMTWERVSYWVSMKKFSIALIKKFKDYWLWSSLTENCTLPSYDAFVLEFKDLIDFESLLWNKNFKVESWVLDYISEWSWDIISKGEDVQITFNWSDELIEKYKGCINWSKFSTNRNVSWDEIRIERFKDFIDWGSFSENVYVPWNISIIKKYYSLLDLGKLSINGGVPTHIIFSEIPIDLIDWKTIIFREELKGIRNYERIGELSIGEFKYALPFFNYYRLNFNELCNSLDNTIDNIDLYLFHTYSNDRNSLNFFYKCRNYSFMPFLANLYKEGSIKVDLLTLCKTLSQPEISPVISPFLTNDFVERLFASLSQKVDKNALPYIK